MTTERTSIQCPRCAFVAVATTEGNAIHAVTTHMVYHYVTKEAGK